MGSRIVHYCYKCIGHYTGCSPRNVFKYESYCSLTEKRCKKACEYYKEDKKGMEEIMNLYGDNLIVKEMNKSYPSIMKNIVKRIAERKFIIDIKEKQHDLLSR